MNGFRGRGRGGFQGGFMGGRGGGMGRGGGGQRQRRQEDKDQFKKLFIGGLSFETTSDTLRKHFEQWGEIIDCVVMKDPKTQKPKGFGFITFSDPCSVDEVQEKRPHNVDGRDVDTKRAMPKEDAGKPECKEPTKKIFLGGLKDDATEDDVRAICEEYGVVEKVDVIKDKDTGKGRGFGFVTFTDTDKVDKIYLKGCLDICGRSVEVKKAVEKSKVSPGGDASGGSGYGRGGGGMGGGMYGQQQQQQSYGGGGGYGGQSYGGQGYGAQQSTYSQGGGYGMGGAGMGSSYEGGYSAGPMRAGAYQQQQRPSPYAPAAGGYSAGGAAYGAGGAAYGAGGGGYGAQGGYGQRRY